MNNQTNKHLPTPVIECRCCGHILRAEEQGHKPIKNADGMVEFTQWYHLLTCDQPKDECKLSGFTFTDRDYANKDLNEYLKVGA
jgi:hypothetical protein